MKYVKQSYFEWWSVYFFHKALQESGYFKLQTVKLAFDFEFIQVWDHNYIHNWEIMVRNPHIPSHARHPINFSLEIWVSLKNDNDILTF